MQYVAQYVVSNLAKPRKVGKGLLFFNQIDKILAANGQSRRKSNAGLDKMAISKAEEDERRRRRNLRGRELIGIANPNNGLGGIQNILGG